AGGRARRSLGSLCTRGVPFFFFQAEDGIRDATVTGVQTCALPISIGDTLATAADTGVAGSDGTYPMSAAKIGDGWWGAKDVDMRSEERRVGRECRASGTRGGTGTERGGEGKGGEEPGGAGDGAQTL